MKRIFTISTLAIAACVGFNSAASAQVTATSTHSGTIAKICSVTSTNGTFTATTTPINGVAFPVSLTSTGGKFTTLCNTASSSIAIEKNASPIVPTGQTPPTVTYDLSGSNTVYPTAGFLTTSIGIDTLKTGTAVHSYSDTSSDLTVVVKVAAATNKILQDGTYTVVLKATLTP